MIFCMHKWKVLSETTTESKIEHMKGILKSPGNDIPYYFMDRKYIQIVACDECGKLKRFVEVI